MQQKQLQLQILGTFDLVSHGEVVDAFGERRDEELLAYLALSSPTLATRDAIAKSMWPDVEVDTGRKHLSFNLFQVRKRFAEHGLEEPVEEVRKRLRLSPSIEIDAHRFTSALASAAATSAPTERVLHLDEAARLYGAGLLPDFDFPWLNPHQEQFSSLYQDCSVQLARLTQSDEPMRDIVAKLPATAWQVRSLSQSSPQESAIDFHALGSSSESVDVQAVMRFAHEAASGLVSGDAASWTRRVRSREFEILKACDQLIASGDAEQAAELVTSLWRYWHLSQRASVGLGVIDQILESSRGLSDGLLASARSAAGNLAFNTGQRARSFELLQLALAYWQRVGDSREMMRGFANTGRSLIGLGRYDEASEQFDHAIALARGLDDSQALSVILMNAGIADVRRRNAESARSRLEERLQLLEQSGATGSRDHAETLNEIASAYILLGDLEQARQRAELALEMSLEPRAPLSISMSNMVLGQVAYRSGEFESAERLSTQAVDAAREHGDAWHLGQALGYRALAQEAMGAPEAAATMWNAVSILSASGEHARVQRFREDMDALRRSRGS